MKESIKALRLVEGLPCFDPNDCGLRHASAISGIQAREVRLVEINSPLHLYHHVSCNDIISGHDTRGTLSVDTGKSLAITAPVAERELLSRCSHIFRFLEHAKQPSTPIVTTTTTVS